MPLQIYTSTVWGYSSMDPDKLDISVKTGSRVFCPSWELVLGYKDSLFSEKQYSKEYTRLMRVSWKENHGAWKLLLSKERIVLCCYCKPKEFCHRLLLADMLVKCGAEYKGEI